MNKYLFLTCFLITSYFYSNAQFNYGVTCSAGLGNIIKIQDTKSKTAKEYDPLPCYDIGFFALERIRDGRWSLEQNFNIELTGSQGYVPKDIWDDTIMEHISQQISNGADPSDFEDWKQNWEERSIRITIPLRIRYDFEKWLIIHIGLSNSFLIHNIHEYNSASNKSYVLRGEAGADFFMGGKLFAGIIYSQDLTPCGQAYDHSYYYKKLSFRIGYKLKQTD